MPSDRRPPGAARARSEAAGARRSGLLGRLSGRRARPEFGVTYIEMLVVAVVAGVLATVAIPTGLVFWRAWKERQLRRALVEIRAALDEYHLDWERGCIESDTDYGWPESLEELVEGKELTDDPECTGEDPDPSAEASRRRRREPKVKQYLLRLPRDPFSEGTWEHDTAGWKARSYADDHDSTSWNGDDIHDIRSASELEALDGTKYATW